MEKRRVFRSKPKPFGSVVRFWIKFVHQKLLFIEHAAFVYIRTAAPFKFTAYYIICLEKGIPTQTMYAKITQIQKIHNACTTENLSLEFYVFKFLTLVKKKKEEKVGDKITKIIQTGIAIFYAVYARRTNTQYTQHDWNVIADIFAHSRNI